MKVSLDKDKSRELLLFEMEWFKSFSLIFQNQIINITNVLNRIYIYRRTVPLRSILEDIEVIKKTRNLTNINK